MISERDKQTAHAIATLLGVELEPWQDFMLQHMLAGHRRPDPPEVAEVRGPYGLCDEPYPEFPSTSCKRARGHTGPHEAVTGPSARSVTWLTKQACGEQMPTARIPAPCTQPAKHPGKHVVGAGDLTGSTWYDSE